MRYLTAAEAAERFPRRVTAKTVRNRMTIGSRGIKLKHIWDGHQYLTSEEWIREYLEQQTGQVVLPYQSVKEMSDDVKRMYA